ncbi:MAG: hypothetical protein WBB19_15715 [Desulforhopalus sp.]
MRCPKCGFISFDHLETCRKCNKNIEATSNSLYGSTYSVQAPAFLKLPQEKKEESSEQLDFQGENQFIEEAEYVDEELEILIEDEDSGAAGEEEYTEDEPLDMGLSEEDGLEEAGEIEIDFSQFEDSGSHESDLFGEDEVEETLQEPAVQQSMDTATPEELSELSDLVASAKGSGGGSQVSESSDDDEFADLDLDELNFDLGLDALDGKQSNGPGISKEAVLALDEIDFSETLAESSSGSSRKSGNMDMDEDLNFDLDLGGLSIHKDA